MRGRVNWVAVFAGVLAVIALGAAAFKPDQTSLDVGRMLVVAVCSLTFSMLALRDR